MPSTRREFLGSACSIVALGMAAGKSAAAPLGTKRHIVSLSFDDGFKKSFAKTAEIFEKYKLSACLNVIALGASDDDGIKPFPVGNFGLWNDLKQRGHEVMPHGYRHERFPDLSFEEGKDAVRRCLDIFREKLDGFDPKQAIFNFPYNASTPQLEEWLPSQVRAFRTGFAAANALPHKGQARLTCASFGPENCEAAIDREVEKLLKRESGWMIFNAHGLDGEGWGPMRSAYLEGLLERLIAIESVSILPVGFALGTRDRDPKSR